jgi:glycerol uptake facilitator-like aquaporin
MKTTVRPEHDERLGSGSNRSKWSGDEIRKHLIAVSGEFCGTFLFLFIALGATQVANTIASPTTGGDRISGLLYVALAFGFSLAVNAWVFYRISGGLFNPAVRCLRAVLPLSSDLLYLFCN